MIKRTEVFCQAKIKRALKKSLELSDYMIVRMITQIFAYFLMVLIGVILILIVVIKDFCTFSEIYQK